MGWASPRRRGDRPAHQSAQHRYVRVPPPKRVVDATFSLRVPLPIRFGGRHASPIRPKSTPTLLKPGDRRHLTKPGKSKSTTKPVTKQSTVAAPSKKALTPRVKKTPEERSEYERARNQTPERMAYNRQYRREQSQIAKKLGLCRHCGTEVIPSQTRCETCAEKHRQAWRKSDAAKSARKRTEWEMNHQE